MPGLKEVFLEVKAYLVCTFRLSKSHLLILLENDKRRNTLTSVPNASATISESVRVLHMFLMGRQEQDNAIIRHLYTRSPNSCYLFKNCGSYNKQCIQ